MTKPTFKTWYCINCEAQIDLYFAEQACARCSFKEFLPQEVTCFCLYISRTDLHQSEIVIVHPKCAVHN